MYVYFFKPAAWFAVIATRLTMSLTEQPLERSFMGAAIPCRTGPMASAFASLWTSLYATFPTLRSGKINTLALPCIGLSGA